MSVPYHPSKANVVGDAVSCMSMGSVSHVDESRKDLVKHVYRFSQFGVPLVDSPNGGFVVQQNFESYLVV